MLRQLVELGAGEQDLHPASLGGHHARLDQHCLTDAKDGKRSERGGCSSLPKDAVCQVCTSCRDSFRSCRSEARERERARRVCIRALNNCSTEPLRLCPPPPPPTPYICFWARTSTTRLSPLCVGNYFRCRLLYRRHLKGFYWRARDFTQRFCPENSVMGALQQSAPGAASVYF